ncbi:hypothetical protein Hanom_Chr17g01574061 [Helianthus anomalus]
MVIWPLSIRTPIDTTFLLSSHFEKRETCLSNALPFHRHTRQHRQLPLQLLQVQSVSRA